MNTEKDWRQRETKWDGVPGMWHRDEFIPRYSGHLQYYKERKKERKKERRN